MFITLYKDAITQKWGGENKKEIWKEYEVNANVGLLSYSGDVSKYDKKPIKKIEFESGPGCGLVVTKHFLPKFSLSGQIIHGNFRGSVRKQTFSTEILEFNFHVRADLIKLFQTEGRHRVIIAPYLGIGQFYFNTTTTYSNIETTRIDNYNTGVPEFLYFLGAGLLYKLPANLSLTGDFSIRQCRNDKLDNFYRGSDFDFYSYLSIGISYKIHSILREPIKNKARLAHEETYFSNRKNLKVFQKE